MIVRDSWCLRSLICRKFLQFCCYYSLPFHPFSKSVQALPFLKIRSMKKDPRLRIFPSCMFCQKGEQFRLIPNFDTERFGFRQFGTSLLASDEEVGVLADTTRHASAEQF